MNSILILIILVSYFIVLYVITYFTNKNSDKNTFFTGNNKSPWLLVSYGMIGAAISGVTFVSLPGTVVNNGFYFGQFLLGNIVGYLFITFVLIPLYYKYKLMSIYGFLKERYGVFTYKTGALIFFISQIFGASLRMLLAVVVLKEIFSNTIDIPIWILAAFFILIIFLYTSKSGIKTLVWTDSLQTTFLIVAVIIVIYQIINKLDISIIESYRIGKEYGFTKFFDFDYKSPSFFIKSFVSGILISIAMMGLDQNMMQKSLTIKNVKDAQKNTLLFSLTVAIVQFLFLFVGMLLYIYAFKNGLNAELPLSEEGKFVTDKVFPFLTVSIQEFGVVASILFILGIIAAALSSADSALTSLTTSFCYDIIDIEKYSKGNDKLLSDNKFNLIKNFVHISISILLLIIIISFSYAKGDIITIIFQTAAYTYSPLLAMFLYGIFSKNKINDRFTPYVSIFAIIFTFSLNYFLKYKYNFDLNFFVIFIETLLIIIALYLSKFTLKNN